MEKPPLQVIPGGMGGGSGTPSRTEEAALAEARTLLAEQLNATVLAATWGWHRSKVQRRLRRWASEGLIRHPAKARRGAKKRPATRKRGRQRVDPAMPGAVREVTEKPVAMMAATESEPSQHLEKQPENPEAPRKGQWFTWRRRGGQGAGPPTSVGGDKPRVPVEHIVLGLVLGVTAVTLGGVGLVLNAGFAASFGRSAEAGALLATLGVVIDVLTLTLPSASVMLWQRRSRLAALGTWVIFVVVLAMSLIAACGFASTNVGDSVQSRSEVTEQRTALAAKLGRLRRERSGIKESRTVAGIDAALQAAPAAAEGVWKQTKGCTEITLKNSGNACAAVIALREARAEAERRDRLDGDIGAAEAEMKQLPTYASADPGAEMAAKLLGSMSGGYALITSEMVEQFRIAGLTVIPAVGGLLLSFAQLLLMPVGGRRVRRQGQSA